MNISVLVPTYRRSRDLERCLEALKQQSCPATEVLVAVRDTDQETHQFLQAYHDAPLPLKVLIVTRPGVIAAMNLGLDHSIGDVIAITDDDAAPHPDWLEKIKAQFLSDQSVGAVGGRDFVYEYGNTSPLAPPPDLLLPVGKLQWIGRIIGNHHIGQGPSRNVDFLKGVNSSYRKSAIEHSHFDERLKGSGAQVHHEIGLCLLLKRQGWKVVYDPSIAVNHYPSPRFDEDQRDSFNFEAYYNAAYNQTLVLLDHQSKFQVVAYLSWSVLTGTRGCFGLAQVVRFLRSQKMLAFDKWVAASSGHIHAVRDRFLLKHTYTSHPSTSLAKESNSSKLITSPKS
jgi:cellulose synthase/poly-beta-1,6-N-acetylglucosamine synthase-like glycosyltransferase